MKFRKPNFNKKKNKKKSNDKDEFQSEIRLRLPHKDDREEFGLVTLMTGSEYIKVLLENGQEISARIPGKMRKKIWIRENDVVIVKMWDTGEPKGDVVWRFMPLQVSKLKSKGYLQNLPI